ncbi:MAG: hemerythrin domain-containing protein [Pseudomonadota bacterium]
MGSVSLGSLGTKTAAAGFDEPLALLQGCHERIAQRCDLLLRLADHVATHGPDAEAALAATGLLRYFRDAGVKHHEDEEQDLFPMLLAAVPAGERGAAAELVDALVAEHRVMAAAWAELEAQLALLAQNRAAALPAEQAARFAALYAEHIVREEDALLPLARRVLDAKTLDRLGAAMAARRGVRREPARAR